MYKALEVEVFEKAGRQDSYIGVKGVVEEFRKLARGQISRACNRGEDSGCILVQWKIAESSCIGKQCAFKMTTLFLFLYNKSESSLSEVLGIYIPLLSSTRSQMSSHKIGPP